MRALRSILEFLVGAAIIAMIMLAGINQTPW